MKRRTRTQADDDGVKYTPQEIDRMIQKLRPQALQITKKWANAGHPDMLLDMAYVNFFRLHTERRFTNFKSFYLDSVRRTCRDRWKENLSTAQRRTIDEAQALKRELEKLEGCGEISSEERRQLEQQIDDKNAEAAFSFDDYGRVISTDNLNDQGAEVSPILMEIGLGKYSPTMRWMIVREELTCIWANLTDHQKKLLTYKWVKGKSPQEMRKKFGKTVDSQLSKLIKKMRKIVDDTEGKYRNATKEKRAFKEKGLQDLLCAVGYADEDIYLLNQ